MLISLEEFSQELNSPAQRALNIIFIGMSNAGKTHWSKKFAGHFGYEHIEFDELIGHSPDLETLLAGYEGKDQAEKMGRYFGMPWTPGFQEREDKFLAIERAIMEQYQGKRGTVLDLTGSAIYHPEQMRRIAQTGIVIYLETSEAGRQELFEKFVCNPRPVCWGGVFAMADGENERDALKRCYPVLLQTRAAMYKGYADITLPYEVHKELRNAEDFAARLIAAANTARPLSEHRL